MKGSVVVLFHRFGPYHVARLAAAAGHLGIVAVELSAQTKEYAWDKVTTGRAFERITLFPDSDSRDASARELRVRLCKVLEQQQPSAVVVPGWSDAGSFAALQWCSHRKVPSVVMSESTAWDERRTAWKEWVKRRIVGLCSSALVGGAPHADYMNQLGMPRDRIFPGYDAVDNDYFSAKAEEIRKQKVESGNIESGNRHPSQLSAFPMSALPQPPFFLSSNRFIEKKNLPRLIQAYSRYRELALKSEIGIQKSEIVGQGMAAASQLSTVNSPTSASSTLDARRSTPWHLVLLGDGPLRATLNSQLSTLNLHEHVLLPGFKQYDELPAYYGLASAFIHASTTEQWGLVVNEAMASGLPVLVSNRCGCARDLVQEGVNGFTFDPHDVEQLAQLMTRISAFNFPLSQFGAESARIINQWGTDRFASGLSAAVDKAMAIGPKRATWLDRLLLRALLTRS